MPLLALVLCLLAPVPKEAHKAPELAHGVYTLMWAGLPYQATLNGNGEFSEFLPDSPQLWVGVWDWDPVLRTLSVSETYDGGTSWCRWIVVLDGNLAGKTNGGTPVQFRPFRPPLPMPEK